MTAASAQTKGANAAISSGTTERSEPPRVLMMVDVRHWMLIADDALRRHNENLKQLQLQQWESGAIFETEGDVVSSSTLYLIYPVHMVIEREFSDDHHHGAEVTVGTTSRVDIGYHREYHVDSRPDPTCGYTSRRRPRYPIERTRSGRAGSLWGPAVSRLGALLNSSAGSNAARARPVNGRVLTLLGNLNIVH